MSKLITKQELYKLPNGALYGTSDGCGGVWQIQVFNSPMYRDDGTPSSWFFEHLNGGLARDSNYDDDEMFVLFDMEDILRMIDVMKRSLDVLEPD